MSDLHIIPVRPESKSMFEPTRYYVDVKSHDPLVDRRMHRIEIHADVAKHIHEQSLKIERLQGELDRVRDRLRAENDEVEKLVERLQTSENENDRYRTALERIRDDERSIIMDYRGHLHPSANIARGALQEQSDE